MKTIKLLKAAAVLGTEYPEGAVLELTDADDICAELLTEGLAVEVKGVEALKVEAEQTKAAVRQVVAEELKASEPDTKARQVVTAGDITEPVDRPNAGFKSAAHFLKDVAKQAQGGGQSAELKAWRNKAATGLNETFGGDGAYLVPPEMAAGIYQIQHDNASLASRCRTIPINNNLIMNAIDETSRATGSRWGGIQCFWQAEATTAIGSTPKFRQMHFELKKLTAAVYATEELLADVTALESTINQAVGEEFAWTVDEAIYHGNGAGTPLGFMNSGALVTVPKEAQQAADTVVAENVRKMWYRLPSANRARSIWLVNQQVEDQLQQMNAPVGMAGQLVYMPPGGLSAAPYGTLFGRPVIANEHSAALGDTGDIVLVDLGEYIYTPKTDGIQSAASIHVQFLVGETVYRFTQRVDGQPAWAAPLTPAKGSATLSPFIALAARA